MNFYPRALLTPERLIKPQAVGAGMFVTEENWEDVTGIYSKTKRGMWENSVEIRVRRMGV